MKRRVLAVIFFVAAISIFAIYQLSKPKCYERTIYNVFDTVSTITTYTKTDYTDKYEEYLRTLSTQLDVHIDNSLISRLNHGETVSMPSDITKLLVSAASYSNKLSEYFDITINPLVESWTLAEEKNVLPDDIADKLSLVGIDNLVIDKENNTAKIITEGSSVTLAAVAKGYATDVIVSQMKSDGVKSAIVNLGGNIYALGKKPDGSEWSVAVADPNNSSTPLLSINVSDKAVVTSGNYERYFEIGGERFNHIINPQTGYPATSSIHSVTVVGDNAMLCDILSTAIFVAGKENAKQIADEFGVDIILIDENTVYHTEKLKSGITMYSNDYELVIL